MTKVNAIPTYILLHALQDLLQHLGRQTGNTGARLLRLLQSYAALLLRGLRLRGRLLLDRNDRIDLEGTDGLGEVRGRRRLAVRRRQEDLNVFEMYADESEVSAEVGEDGHESLQRDILREY